MFRKSPLSGYLLLALFLFPQVHKAVHDLGHLDDFHCQAVSEKHFHEYHAQCLICDYKQPVRDEGPFALLVSFIFSYDRFIFPELADRFVQVAVYSRTSRGPPALSV